MPTQLNAATRLRTKVQAAPNYSYSLDNLHKDLVKLGFTQVGQVPSKGPDGAATYTYEPGPVLQKQGFTGKVKVSSTGTRPPKLVNTYTFRISLRSRDGKVTAYLVEGKLRADLPGFLARVKAALKGELPR